MIFISDEAEKFGDIQHFCLTEKFCYFTFYAGQYINIVKNEMFDSQTMYDCVTNNLNSEQLVLDLE